MPLPLPRVEIFTDGACRGNPGLGAWAALLRYQTQEKELSGTEGHTTNNRMELKAAIEALSALKKPCQIILSTDSQYVKRGITEWVPQWQKRNWKTAQRAPVKNSALWQQLVQEVARHQVQWRWVKGHSGHAENERVDKLANIALDQLKKS